MDRDEIITKIKLFLGSNANEDYISIAFDTAKEEILNYCNIKEIPAGLVNTLINMAADIYRTSNYGSGISEVNSITEGDVTVTLGGADTSGQTARISQYKEQLNRYRKLVFK